MMMIHVSGLNDQRLKKNNELSFLYVKIRSLPSVATQLTQEYILNVYLDAGESGLELPESMGGDRVKQSTRSLSTAGSNEATCRRERDKGTQEASSK
jgi:hypothetical protein